jgi:hypothetical protein
VPLSEIDGTGGADDPLQSDPEVRQARSTAQAARSRLAACVVGPQVDLAEAQRMLDALRRAEAFAADAEDRVLVRNSLLTTADANRRAAARNPATEPPCADGAHGAAFADGAHCAAFAGRARGASFADGAQGASFADGALVIPFRTVQVPIPVPALPSLPPLPAGARRTAVRAARALLPVAAAALAGAALARQLRRARREPGLKGSPT